MSNWKPGEDLPPIGAEVEIVKNIHGDTSAFYKLDIEKGTAVKIIAHHIPSGSSDKPVAVFMVEHKGSKYVRQAIASVFGKKLSPEEIMLNEVEREVGGLTSREKSLVLELIVSGFIKLKAT